MSTTLKRILASFSIIIILTFSFTMSFCKADLLYSYAVTSWEDVSRDDLVSAFRYYCKSRNLAIDGSVADAITSFTTSTFNSICDTLGINVTQLQAELKKTTDTNIGLRFLFTQNGISAYNRIFAEFLQNNDLTVGESVDNEIVQDGDFFTYGDYNCFIWVMSQDNFGVVNYPSSKIIKAGSFLNSGSIFKDLYDSGTRTFSYPFLTSNLTLSYSNSLYRLKGSAVYGSVRGTAPTFNSGTIIYLFGGRYYLGCYYEYILNHQHMLEFSRLAEITVGNSDVSNAEVYITTNNKTINNNDYSENYTIIYNNGDHGGHKTEPSPDAKPSKPKPNTSTPGGNYTPPGITPGQGGGSTDTGTVDLPDIDFNLPDIDWSIDGLSEKFPFSIPFDLYAFVQVLDAEPETPKFTGDVNLIVTTWHLDYDLSAFDDLASIIRNIEFIGFCFGLILITRKIIKG